MALGSTLAISRRSPLFEPSRSSSLSLPVRSDEATSDAVKRVPNRVVEFPFDIAGLLADRTFYNGAAIQQFSETAPVVQPVIPHEKQLAEKLAATISCWTEYTMYERSERELPFPLAVRVSYQQGKRGKDSLLVRAYAACDRGNRTPKQVETHYQKRSAIETSFRTMREAWPRTATPDPIVRLLFVLVSFLLRTLWLIARWGVLATPRRSGRALPVWFRFEVFRAWIDHVLDETLARKQEAPTDGIGIPATYRQLDAG